MIYLKLISFFLVCVNCITAQDFYIVEDQDGYANVRNSENKIIDKLPSGKAVFSFYDRGNYDKYVDVEYNKGDAHFYANIHESRLKEISSFTEVPIVDSKENSVLLQKESVKVEISKKKYKKGNRTYLHNNENLLVRIDEKYIWGTDGGIPKEEYESFKISMGNTNLLLPYNAYSDLFDPNLDYTKIYYNKESDSLYITSMNGDGAGGYVVLWLFQKGIFEERLVLHGF